MKDEEMIIVAALIVGAAIFLKANKQGRLPASGGSPRPSTVASSPSKRPSIWRNNLGATNAQQDASFRAAPVAQVGTQLNGQGSIRSAGALPPSAVNSSVWTSWASSFVAPQLPQHQVTSTGTRRIRTPGTSVPNYTTVPLTINGPGGGGSWLRKGGN